MFKKLIEPADVSDLELAKFWGTDVGGLTASQRLLVAELYQRLKKP